MTPEQDEPLLLQLPERPVDSEPLVNPLFRPIWTANKARLIEEYLRLFVYITRHGTYIDGFAGPQRPHLTDMWAAKRVLETQRRPRRIQHYHLFELHSERFKQLERLKAEQPADLERTIDLYEGDFNIKFREILRPGVIKDSEATFCLLDQRTFECHWSTVKALAEHKSGRKIEIFYFLAMKWLARSLKGITRNTHILENWWGRSDWDQLRQMSSIRCADEMVKRFKEELGYASVKKWPIFRTKSPGNVMYYMIHATDHDQAPILMRRAYEKAVTPVHTEQLSFFPNLDDYLLTGASR